VTGWTSYQEDQRSSLAFSSHLSMNGTSFLPSFSVLELESRTLHMFLRVSQVVRNKPFVLFETPEFYTMVGGRDSHLLKSKRTIVFFRPNIHNSFIL
jgi:hypothetical protein